MRVESETISSFCRAQTILESKSFTLEQLLDEDDLIQECKSQFPKASPPAIAPTILTWSQRAAPRALAGGAVRGSGGPVGVLLTSPRSAVAAHRLFGKGVHGPQAR